MPRSSRAARSEAPPRSAAASRAYVPRTSSIARMCVGRRKTSVLTRASAATSSPHSSQRSGRRDSRIGDAHTQISGAIRTVAHRVADPPHRPEDRIALGARQLRERSGRDAEGRADQRAAERRPPDQQQNITQPSHPRIEREPPQQGGAHDRLQRVSRGDDRRAPDRDAGRDVDDERRERRPPATAACPRRTSAARRDPRRRPHRRRDAGQRIERQPEARRRHIRDEDDGVIQASPDSRRHRQDDTTDGCWIRARGSARHRVTVFRFTCSWGLRCTRRR